MGRYMFVGVATHIYVKRERYTTEKILDELQQEIDLNIYDIDEENSKYLILNLKKDIFENNIEDLLTEERNFCSAYDELDILNKLCLIRGKKYEEILSIMKESQGGSFYISGEKYYSNNIGYIAKDLDIYCDLTPIVCDGEVYFECYFNMFKFIRKHIIKSLKNPLRSAIFVTIAM